MNYIYNYKDFKTNEGILDGLLNFFKNLWKKVSAELQKIEDDPNKIKEYIVTNILDTKSPTSIFKKEIDDFRAKKLDTDEACFDFIDSILNKDTGVLGKQGIGMLFSDKSLQGDKMKVKRISFEYIIGTARDQVIKKLKYDQKKNIERTDKGFKDNNYLPAFKAMLLKNTNSTSTQTSENILYRYYEFIKEADTPVSNEPTVVSPSVTPNTNSDNSTQTNTQPASNTNETAKNIENIIKWVETNISGDMINITKSIREDDIKAAVAKGGGTTNNNYKQGEIVKYKMDKFIEGTPPEKQPQNIGAKSIEKIQNDIFTFKKEDGSTFTKTKEQIIGKADDNEAPQTKDITTKLGAIKQKNPKQLDTVNKVLDLLNTTDGQQKIDSILNET